MFNLLKPRPGLVRYYNSIAFCIQCSTKFGGWAHIKITGIPNVAPHYEWKAVSGVHTAIYN